MKELLQSFFKDYRPIPAWDTDRTGRTKLLLSSILEKADGDILEIGAHRGTTTQVFCEIGARFGRKVYVIDPWDGRQEGSAEVYNAFLGNMSKFSNYTVHKCGSETPQAFNAVKDLKFAYILIDGLHSYDAVVSDFTKYRAMLTTNGVICVDDWSGPYAFSQQIRRAIKEYLGHEFIIIESPDVLIEKYVVRANGQ